MSCSIVELREKFPETVILRFISETGDPITNTNIGYLTEFEKLGNDTDSPELRNLRCIDNINEIFNTPNILLNKVELFCFDALKLGSTYQDAATNTAITNSRTATKAYAQSAYINAVMPVMWQPNYVRPLILANNKPVFRGANSPNADYPIANNSIGLILPTCLELNTELGMLTDFTIATSCAQYISETNKFKNYPVMGIVEFWINK